MDGKTSCRILMSVIIWGGCVFCQPTLAQPSCTFGTDNDRIDNSRDIDDDNDGLIEICSLEGLDAIRHQLDGSGYKTAANAPLNSLGCKSGGCNGYELTEDLDFSGSSYTNWNPIGDNSNRFNAKFNGNGRTISNLTIDKSNQSYIALLGYTGVNSYIKNIGLLNVQISGNRYVGGLVGQNEGRITNSYVSTGNVKGNTYVGGLVGENSSSSNPNNTISNSYAAVNVGKKNAGNDVGGLVGSNARNIFNSYAIGNIVGKNNIGGLAGQNSGNIFNSYATGSVLANGNRIGGFIGKQDSGKVQNNYAAGEVRGNTDVGGFVGRQEEIAFFQDGGKIKNNYAAGKVDGNTHVGGFIGFTNAEGGITDSYWDATTSEINVSAGGTSQTTIVLQETAIGEGIYANWNAAGWHNDNNTGYPIIRYAKGNNENPACGGEEQPICGHFLRGQNILALEKLTISKLNEATNLLENFDPEIARYIIVITSDVSELKFTPKPFNDDTTIKIKNVEVSTSTTIKIKFKSGENDAAIPIALESGASSRTYNIIIYKTGLCDATNIDKDGDGLIEICSEEGLDAIRYQLDGTAYKVEAELDAPIIEGCYNNTGQCRGYELKRDLDLEGIVFKDRNDWQPIGNSLNWFAAIFEGNGHTISNLIINRPSQSYIALFGYTSDSAIINTVGLLEVDIKGYNNVGGIVGWNNGTIANSYVIGIVQGSNHVGGFVGYHNNGNILNSYAAVAVSGEENIGGLIAYQRGGTIQNAYASGDVSGNEYVGGFIGYQRGGTIQYGYAIGRVTSNSNGNYVGGFSGRSNSIINSYWNADTHTINTNIGGTSTTTVKLKSHKIKEEGIYKTWNTIHWHSGTNNDYPILKHAAGTVGVNTQHPLCGGNGRPACGTALANQLPPLNTLTLQSSREASSQFKNEPLSPSFEPDIYNYEATIAPDATHIQFIIAAPTTRHVTYQIDNGGFTTEHPVGGTPAILPPMDPIALGLDRTKIIAISVAAAETDPDQTAELYTIRVEHPVIFVQLKVLLEGGLQPP